MSTPTARVPVGKSTEVDRDAEPVRLREARHEASWGHLWAMWLECNSGLEMLCRRIEALANSVACRGFALTEQSILWSQSFRLL